MFAKGFALCLPFIGHITSIALRCFSSSIFPEMPLDFAIKCSYEQKLAIAKQIYTDKPEEVNEAARLALANILADDVEGLDLLVAHILYLDLTTNKEFSLKIIQQKPEVLDQIKSPRFAKQILKKDPKNPKFIVDLFNSLNFNKATQEAVIKKIICQIDSSTSGQMQIAIAHTIIEKHFRGPGFLLNNINQFNHTQELADLLLETSVGKTYIADNIDKFNLLEEQKNSLLQKCPTSVLV